MTLRTKPDTGTAHTPGQWTAIRNEHYWEISSDAHGQIGDACASKFIHVNGKQLSPEDAEPIAAANARLMAAAPDMFEALRDVVTFASLYNGKMEDTLGDEALAALGETALAVLTRAEGRQP